MKNFIYLSLLLLLSVTGIPSSASAQDARENTGDEFLDEILVTAQKREQTVLEVPMAIAVLPAQELEQRGITAITDLQFAVPGMTMREDGPGSNTVFLRGIVNQYGNGAVVGQYLDEIPITLTAYDQLDMRVLDLERIEVLKGPQGTLYGQGSVAGTVRYITKKPVLDRIETGFSVSAASIDGGNTEGIVTGVLNFPIVDDTFGVRIAARLQNGGGWQDQPAAGIEDGNDQELVNVRVKALWQVSDRTDIEFTYVHHRNEVQLGLGYEDPDRTVFVAGDPATVLIPKDMQYAIANLTANFDLGFGTLTSATSYIDNDHKYPFAYQCGPETNCGPFEGNDDRADTGTLFTQEFRLTSNGDDKLQWTIGAFYREVEDELVADYRTFNAASATPFVSIFTDTFISRDDYESYAVFADVSYQVTDRLQIGVGGRYFDDDQSTASSCCVQLGVPFSEQSGNFDSFDPRVYLSYALSEDTNLYASAGSGFRSGGFNSFGDPPYDPEDIVAYEIGIKGFKPESKVSFELAAFFSDYSDMLRRGLVFNGTNFTSQLSNIGDVDVVGIEGGVAVQAGDNFRFEATGAWLDAEVKAIRADDATSLPGDSLDYVPEYSATVSGIWNFDWSPNRPGFVRLDYSHRDKVSYVDRTSFVSLPQFSDSIGLLNFRVGMQLNDDWSLDLFGTNLTDENELLDPYHQWRNANRTRPRTIGVKLTFDPS